VEKEKPRGARKTKAGAERLEAKLARGAKKKRNRARREKKRTRARREKKRNRALRGNTKSARSAE
jgi:hypothetical protein